MNIEFSTLCYMEKEGRYLMLHRNKKQNDLNHDKWIGVGDHLEPGESPEECLIREVREETGYLLTSYRFRALVTFVSGDDVTEYMALFTADGFTGEEIPCNEGELKWIPVQDVMDLNLWEGDRVFLDLLVRDEPFFTLKLMYNEDGDLIDTKLNRY